MNCIDRSDIIFLWHLNYYDGILSGIGTYQEKPIYFSCTHEDDDEDRARTFEVFPLTDVEFAEAKVDHVRFEKYVGTHTSRNPDGTRTKDGFVRPGGTWSEYYNQPRDCKNFDLATQDRSRVIGSFTW